MKTIQVPDEMYDLFLAALDYGIQSFEANGTRDRWTPEEKACAEFIEARGWEREEGKG